LGSNKRYADYYDRLMSDRIAEGLIEGKTVQSLGKHELDLEHEPVTRPPQPRPVRAWVRFNDVPLLVDAEMVAWTNYAAAIRWKIRDTEYKAWVWGSAIRDAPPRRIPRTRGSQE
jgi:hypothetical protein